MYGLSPTQLNCLNGHPVSTLQEIRIAVTVGRLFQKTRQEQKIGLHAVSIQSGIPMSLLVKIESGNTLSIKRNSQYIDQITHMIAKNLHVDIDEYYPSLAPLAKSNEAQITTDLN
jgi:cytoskeletal protein RodZ